LGNWRAYWGRPGVLFKGREGIKRPPFGNYREVLLKGLAIFGTLSFRGFGLDGFFGSSLGTRG